MINYRCNNCNIPCETSICPVCNQRADIVGSKVYWCDECNIPLYNKECKHEGHNVRELTTDIRPVFPEERLMLEILIGEPFKFINCSVWNGVGNKYYIDGKRLKVTVDKLMERKSSEVIDELKTLNPQNNYEMFYEYIDKFLEENRYRFNEIDTEAMNFINEQKDNFKFDETFVSFSGGKDSTVVSDLVTRALGTQKVLHIFGDTTLEFPHTMEYADRFHKNNPKIPFLSARNKEKNFYDMCEVIGPPSRVMRWCCIVFKTGAITRRIDTTFKNKKRVLTFYGIRRSESVSRSKYDKVSQSPKITKQHVVSPIIDWYDFDIWLYILSRNIDFNYAYRLGYSRVGCWCCPNNSKWSQYLSSIYMPDEYEKWRKLLINFAKKVGKPDAEVYVDEGKWKARQGGNGLSISRSTFVEFKPCVTASDSFNYELNKPITEELYEFFKPFGWLNFDMGNKRLGQVYVNDRSNNPVLILEGRLGEKNLKVTIINTKILGSKSLRDVKQKVDCQITKYQMCLGCLACESVCKHDAISVKKAAHKNENIGKNDNEYYKINDDKCKRCGECINHFDGGCYMRKVLITKRGE
ncbi:phosphoadenosine phosphosulfate reductase family protein [Clostridium sp. YIM B02515]|uniref:Phosphoadenosine phosphosulfate reductase family protein n=1 Tax=Clostridium rhizosphaerae TaxID=2803861 RepID=A0ABS1T8D5_9CLOT|nr:phosphoadenosine phosphosulfate reductase family protein [Clostridium rhizosphaerae]MBL4935575.1 phosphoadenosine phosphosulfate reductase family protein [Clostridium rhizosphaerae]